LLLAALYRLSYTEGAEGSAGQALGNKGASESKVHIDSGNRYQRILVCRGTPLTDIYADMAIIFRFW
jgi:hypothetical protein